MVKNAMILLTASQESPFLDTPYCRVEIVVTSETDSSTGYVTKKSLSLTTVEGNRLGLYEYEEEQTSPETLHVMAHHYLSNLPPTDKTLVINESNGRKALLNDEYTNLPQTNLPVSQGLLTDVADGEKCVLAFYSAKST